MPSDSASISRWSRAIAPNSLITTAVSARSGLASTRPRKVVLPLPRNPVSTDSAIGTAGTMASDFKPGSTLAHQRHVELLHHLVERRVLLGEASQKTARLVLERIDEIVD